MKKSLFEELIELECSLTGIKNLIATFEGLDLGLHSNNYAFPSDALAFPVSELKALTKSALNSFDSCVNLISEGKTDGNIEKNCTKISTIGERLRMLRGEKTQEEVAYALGISRSALGMYECGERIPKDDIKRSIAEYYNQTVQEIFYDE